MAAGVGAAAAGGFAYAARDVLPALGGRPDSATLLASPRFRDGAFHNPLRPRFLPEGSGQVAVRELVLGNRDRRPHGAVPLVPPAGPAPDTGVHVTWYGHASSLVELDGTRVLFDPVWSERVSPSQAVGPRRLHPVPHRLTDLPRLDAIAISHDHYDHLDMATVVRLTELQDAPFVVPLGVGAHLRRWNVPENRIVELDWGGSVEVAGARLVATPARHFSGRGFARNNTLWLSWALLGDRHRVFYTGDSGYFDGYAAIGAEHGPFDATLVQVGAYFAAWPDIHMTPEEGVAAHRDVRGGLLLPIHWATFNLAPHPWADPADRVWQAAKQHGVALALPRPGERVDVAAPPPVDGWWQALATPAGVSAHAA
ncbi:MBL fold metallo-hydrolase [Prauserella shujinwangii]|nr:MBL fold metallo-hydrolase [Prauserella shujinwangii]